MSQATQEKNNALVLEACETPFLPRFLRQQLHCGDGSVRRWRLRTGVGS